MTLKDTIFASQCQEIVVGNVCVERYVWFLISSFYWLWITLLCLEPRKIRLVMVTLIFKLNCLYIDAAVAENKSTG